MQVDENKVFWLNKDHFQPVAKVYSVEEMVEALKVAPAKVCEHHMKYGKNDFAEWAEKSLKDSVLAGRLKSVRLEDPQATLLKIRQAFEGRLREVKTPAAPPAQAQHFAQNKPSKESYRR